jgi:hypothetical protein
MGWAGLRRVCLGRWAQVGMSNCGKGIRMIGVRVARPAGRRGAPGGDVI